MIGKGWQEIGCIDFLLRGEDKNAVCVIGTAQVWTSPAAILDIMR